MHKKKKKKGGREVCRAEVPGGRGKKKKTFNSSAA